MPQKLIVDLVKDIETVLQQRYTNSILTHQYAWWMLEKLTNKTKANLILDQTITLSPEQKKTIKTWITEQVEQKKPLQYILGSVPFGPVTIQVEPPILIPRPETEEWTFQLITKLLLLKNQQLTILDLCTGTGCIALACAYALPSASIWATDISKKAIQLARKNAQHNNLTNIQFIESDLFSALSSYIGTFDLILCNPPYITPEDYRDLDDSVKEWEDRQALVAEDYGLELIKKIITAALPYFKQNRELSQHAINQLYIEVGHKQIVPVVEYMNINSYNSIQVYTDMYGNNRVVSGSIQHVVQENGV